MLIKVLEEPKARVRIIWLEYPKWTRNKWKMETHGAAYRPMNYEGRKFLKRFLKLTDLPSLYCIYWQ